MMTIDHEFYRYHFERTRRDSRLSLSSRIFYESLVNMLDLNEQDHIHEPMRTLIEEMNLSMGAITNAIPLLIEYGYIRGGKYPNERNLESWRLYLVDLRLTASQQEQGITSEKMSRDVKHFKYGEMSITLIVEQEAETSLTD